MANTIVEGKHRILKRQPGILEIPRGTLLETQMLSELTCRCLKFPVVAARPSVIPGRVHSVQG